MTVVDTSVMQERIGQLCGQFKLPTIAAETVARFTAAGHGDAVPTFLEVLEQEAEDRRHRRINRLRREAQSALAAVTSPEIRPTPSGESLEQFLAKLPDLWRQDAAHTSRERRVQPPRTWRTRPDPFEGVWCDVLSWLQEDPDASAVVLLGRLQEAEPDRFSRAHLRTLQRRVQQWRGIMSKELVYAAAGEPMAGLPAMPELALVGADPKC